jgi:hypothetical protein
MFRSYLIVFAVMIFSSVLFAATWTVDNHPGANFNTLSAAHTAASSGDTILISGSALPYAGITFTKQLTLIGPGFFLNENTGLQANIHSARVGACTFSSGSANSVVMGVYFTNTVTIFTGVVKIRRCRVENTSYGIIFQSGSDGSEVSQSYIENTLTNSSPPSILINASLADIKINNNYIDHAGTSYYAISTAGSSSLSGSSAIFNNVIRQHVDISGGVIYNNILISGNFSSAGATTYNNIGNSTQFGTENGNQINVNMTDVFVESGTSDGQWQIAADGPADDNGFGGTDCGMFENGINMGYVLSGIPPVPAIYDFSATTDLSDITVNARANQ